MPEGAGNKDLSSLTSHEQDVLIAFLSNLKPDNVEVDYDGLAATLNLSTRASAHEAWKAVQKKLFGHAKLSSVQGPRPAARPQALGRKTCFSFASPAVVLQFGKHEKLFHKEALLQIPYFQEKLKNMTSTATAIKRLSFPLFFPESGEMLAKWVYFQELAYDTHEVTQFGKGEASDAACTIFRAYDLAMHLNMEDWANHLIDLLVAIPSDHSWLLACFEEAESHPDHNIEKMELLIVSKLAPLVRTYGLFDDSHEGVKTLANKVSQGGVFAVILVQALAGQQSLEEIAKVNKCAWHVHDKTEKCT
ncbi:hypothetical protein AYL99_07709 [Fonsecaea erecta]|uniref:BTB domain-containing protein n=1 Tax=Fonsecaea erecta TaxID=1367422 RepID=A0A178ZFQ4_9EURO|nr:hypothetical protein AYL99_07709 [Fonsecaea erecta]OAP58619.1 hypothetical protein AYL99_07709 [Fonsecaea erecta]